MKRSITKLAAALALVVAPGLVLLPGQASANESSVAGATSPVGQTNGTVWSLAAANGAVFAVGDFTSVRPSGAAAGTGETPRQFMAGWTTAGALLPFSHTFTKANSDGTTSPVRPSVVTASPNGQRLYIGGDFTSVDGQPRFHVAAFNTTDINNVSLVSNTLNDPAGSWPVSVGGKVTAMAVSPDNATLYMGGAFGYVKGAAHGPTSDYSVQQARKNLGAVSTSDNPTGSGLLSSWAANTGIDNVPYSMVVAPGTTRVLVGGAFTAVTVSGAAVPNTYSAVSLDPATGNVQSDFTAGAHSAIPVPTSACTSVVRDIVVDGTQAYFGDEGTGSGCFDGTFAANLSNGSLVWKNTCLGATQAIAVVGNFLYKGSHAHDCQLTNTNGDPDNYPQVPGPSARHLLDQNVSNGYLGSWYPNTDGLPLGPRAMATDGTNLWVGGDFSAVNGRKQQGIARFSPGDAAPNAPGVSAVSPAAGKVKVSVLAPLDLDDTDLNITLYKAGVPVQTWTNVHSLFWKQPVLNYYDANPGTGAQTYTARAQEVAAPAATGPQGSSTVNVATLTSRYAQAVQASSPSAFWRLDDPANAGLAGDWSNTSAGQAGRYYAAGARAAGATSDGDQGTVFGGTQDTYGQGPTVYSGNVLPAPGATSAYSLEAWFKTSTTQGGKLIGAGTMPTGLSKGYDRQVYLDNAGHVIFGSYSAGYKTIASPAAYNNNAWHHVVATQGSGGMVLYVDGLKIGSNLITTHANFAGYWRVGGDNLSGWPSAPASNYFNGTIDDVAIYNAALSASQVSAHYTSR